MTIRYWTTEDYEQLKALVKEGKHNNKEIGRIMDRNPSSVSQRLRRMGLRNHAYQNRSPYYEVREEVKKYFREHSREETMQRFNLDPKGLKRLLKSTYDKFPHLNKDTRAKEPWSFDEMIFLLRCAGIQSRTWIAEKAGRGSTPNPVRFMLAKLRCKARHLNGLPKYLADELIGHSIKSGIKVNHGPPGHTTVIIPWVVLYSRAKKIDGMAPHILLALSAMASFQKKIHGTEGVRDTLASLRRINSGLL